jgi:type IV secretion system protein VirB9
MNRRPLTAANAALACMLALTIPVASQAQEADSRLVDRLYNPDEVVRIEGKVNVQVTIKFDPNEHIENVAIGDSNAWQVTPNKRANLLFVKPLAPTATTNMTVVTDRRSYFFDLVANPKAQPLYALAFEYPHDESETVAGLSGNSERANAVEVAAAHNPYAIVDPAELNFDWKAKGDKKLLPEKVYDDGSMTFLTWAIGSPIPAVLVKDEQGTEGPVNFAVRGQVLVIDEVPGEIILRSGSAVATLKNVGQSRPAGSGSRTFARAGEFD